MVSLFSFRRDVLVRSQRDTLAANHDIHRHDAQIQSHERG